MDSSLEEIAKLSVDDLLEQLAELSTTGGLPFDRNRKRAIGLALFRGWFNRVKHLLCHHNLNLIGGNNPEDVARDAATIADVLLAMGDRLPLATLSVLIAKYGLEQLCREESLGE